jgi:hypothetical protein
MAASVDGAASDNRSTSSAADSASDGWGEVANELLKASQDDSEETLKCDACRSESTNPESIDSASSDAVSRPRSWWGELIKIHTGSSKIALPAKKLSVVSACAGIFAEGEALKVWIGVGQAAVLSTLESVGSLDQNIFELEPHQTRKHKKRWSLVS